MVSKFARTVSITGYRIGLYQSMSSRPSLDLLENSNENFVVGIGILVGGICRKLILLKFFFIPLFSPFLRETFLVSQPFLEVDENLMKISTSFLLSSGSSYAKIDKIF